MVDVRNMVTANKPATSSDTNEWRNVCIFAAASAFIIACMAISPKSDPPPAPVQQTVVGKKYLKPSDNIPASNRALMPVVECVGWQAATYIESQKSYQMKDVRAYAVEHCYSKIEAYAAVYGPEEAERAVDIWTGIAHNLDDGRR